MPTESSVSTAKQGGKLDAATHFILIPIFLANFIVAVVVAWHADQRPALHWWLVVVSLALLIGTAKTRMYALAVQDRVIRLEERLRIAALVPGADVYKLSMKQLIGLRFAPDAELPGLVHRAIAENLEQKAIKAAIVGWRADNERI